MKKIGLFSLVLFLSFFSNAQKMEKIWETSGLEAPESIVHYQGHYYVSNVAGQPAEKNGLGYISKISENGEIVVQKWAVGFNAPKGLGIHGSEMFVADVNVVAIVDMNTGKIKEKLHAESATFLNDIEISSSGNVYVTDTFGGNAIYKVSEGTILLLLKDEGLNYPNGLLLEGDNLYVSTWGVVTNPETFETEVPGKLVRVDLKTKELKDISTSFGNLDGLARFGDSFLVSDWIAGGLLAIDAQGNVNELLDLAPGSADILYEEGSNLVLVPEMIEGKLSAYKIKD